MFSSPHLIRVEERIRINGVPVRSDVFDQALEKVRLATESRGISVTFFEITFLASLIVASEADVDVVVMDTGILWTHPEFLKPGVEYTDIPIESIQNCELSFKMYATQRVHFFITPSAGSISRAP